MEYGGWKIKLTQGKYALVDREDYERLNQYKWYFNGQYAVRHSPTLNGKRGTIWMHREILKPSYGFVTDHINRDRLDNRRVNLRDCTPAQNRVNSKKRTDNTSGFIGVTYEVKKKLWIAQVEANGKNRKRRFKKKEDAAKYYNELARTSFGEYAQLNQIGGAF